MRKRGKAKRGQVRREVVLWIVAILTLIIFGVFAYFLYYKTPELIDKETCRMSVIERGLWLARSLPEDYKPSLQCKTQSIEIKTTNEEEIKRTMANAMFDCWDMLGEGKIDFLGVSYDGWGPTTTKRCIICSRIIFDERVKRNVDEVENFDVYLQNTKIPRRNATYLEYFTNTENAVYDTSTTGYEASIPLDNNYAVLFSAIKNPSTLIEHLYIYGYPIAVGTGTGALMGFVGGPLGSGAGALIGFAVGLTGAGTMVLKEWVNGMQSGCTDDGCTTLLLVPYTSTAIDANCDTLDSLP